jgi:large subunit ribosomal protein L20
MARVKGAVNARKKHKKVLKLAKGYYGGRGKLFTTANETVIRAMRNAYIGRKLKKRDYRKLWITRINAACRMNGMSYSKFMNGIKVAGIDMNRKMLSEIAIYDAKAFAELVEVAKNALENLGRYNPKSHISAIKK